MASFFNFLKKNRGLQENQESSEKDNGIIGRYYENELPVIVKFVNELPNVETRRKFPMLTVVSWQYDGSENNGMPLSEINNRMINLEGALYKAMDSSGDYYHAYSRTGNNLKEFVYYSISQESFMELLNVSLASHEQYPIEIHFYEDSNWEELNKLLKNFSA